MEIKLVSPKGNQHWIFSRRTNAKAEAPIVWPLVVKSPFIGKDSDAGTIEGRRRSRWQRRRWLDGIIDSMGMSFRKIKGEGQGCLALYSPWGRKESDISEWLTNNSDPKSDTQNRNHVEPKNTKIKKKKKQKGFIKGLKGLALSARQRWYSPQQDA